jgi:hypothetical protein
LLEVFRSLIDLRHRSEALRRGAYRDLAAEGPLYVFVREADEDRMIVGVNAGDGTASVRIAEGSGTMVWGRGELGGGTVTVPGRSAGVWRA